MLTSINLFHPHYQILGEEFRVDKVIRFQCQNVGKECAKSQGQMWIKQLGLNYSAYCPLTVGRKAETITYRQQEEPFRQITIATENFLLGRVKEESNSSLRNIANDMYGNQHHMCC